MKKSTALTDEEKRVVKALLAEGMRNQDIHALINYERSVTVSHRQFWAHIRSKEERQNRYSLP
jgi:hypothetical protein